MKIQPKHYAHIKAEFAKVPFEDLLLIKQDAETRAKCKTTFIIFALARAANLTKFVCDEVYKYANDDHLHTAYKKAAKELNYI